MSTDAWGPDREASPDGTANTSRVAGTPRRDAETWPGEQRGQGRERKVHAPFASPPRIPTPAANPVSPEHVEDHVESRPASAGPSIPVQARTANRWTCRARVPHGMAAVVHPQQTTQNNRVPKTHTTVLRVQTAEHRREAVEDGEVEQEDRDREQVANVEHTGADSQGEPVPTTKNVVCRNTKVRTPNLPKRKLHREWASPKHRGVIRVEEGWQKPAVQITARKIRRYRRPGRRARPAEPNVIVLDFDCGHRTHQPRESSSPPRTSTPWDFTSSGPILHLRVVFGDPYGTRPAPEAAATCLSPHAQAEEDAHGAPGRAWPRTVESERLAERVAPSSRWQARRPGRFMAVPFVEAAGGPLRACVAARLRVAPARQHSRP